VFFISSCSLFLSSALSAFEPPCEGEFSYLREKNSVKMVGKV
jgi:hypothetical protein